MLHDVDEDEATPLLLAVGSGDSDIVKALVERHADVNAVNRVTFSDFHWLCERTWCYHFASNVGVVLSQ